MQNILQLGNNSYIDVDLDENEFRNIMFNFQNPDITLEYQFK